MDHLMYLFTAVVLIAAALAGIAVWAPRALRIKISALALAALLMPTGYASLVDLLGKPKSVTMEWTRRAVQQATVLAASMRENQAIYLWLQFDDNPEPRAYVRPWNLEVANQLQKAMRQAKAEGTTVRIRRPFAPDSDPNTQLFYAEPQPTLPPKSSLATSTQR